MEKQEINFSSNNMVTSVLGDVQVWTNPNLKSGISLLAYVVSEFQLNYLEHFFSEKALVILDFLPKFELEIILHHSQFDKLNNIFFLISDEFEDVELLNLIEKKGGSILKLNPEISELSKKDFLEKTFYSIGVSEIRVMSVPNGI